MTDIAHVHAKWLAVYVRKTRNFAPLADWLKGGGEIGQPLRQVLADIVAGNLKVSTKKATRANLTLPGLLAAELDFWKREFRSHAPNDKGGPPAFTWDEVETVLKLAGVAHNGTPDTFDKLGQCTNAARKVVGWLHHLTASQLDELAHPRTARPRLRIAG